MPYNEMDAIRALQNTNDVLAAASALEMPDDLDGLVLVKADDVNTLREVALARRDKDGQAQIDLTLEVLNKRYAVYGTGEDQIRINRLAYDSLGRPSRLLARIDGVKS